VNAPKLVIKMMRMMLSQRLWISSKMRKTTSEHGIKLFTNINASSKSGAKGHLTTEVSEFLKEANEWLKKAEAEVQQWNQFLLKDTNDPQLREFANERLIETKANAHMRRCYQFYIANVNDPKLWEQANELLKEATAHYLQLMKRSDVTDLLLREMKEMKKALIGNKLSESYSNTTFGQIEYARLKEDGLMIDAAIRDDEEAFWSEQVQREVDAITNEAEFHKHITPFFNNVLGRCGMVFVNSEQYQWLPQSPFVTSNTVLQPDGFATHRGMYRRKPTPDGGCSSNEYRFGIAQEELFDCLILFESKLAISHDAFGQVLRYLQYLCPDESASAILFYLKSFWLIKSHKMVVTKVVKSLWVDKGSKVWFRDCITSNKSPWITRLTDACNLLGVDVVEGDAFLGRGVVFLR